MKDYVVGVPASKPLDSTFIIHAILGMAPKSVMDLHILESPEFGIEIFRLDQETYAVQECPHNDSLPWRLIQMNDGAWREAYGHFESVVEDFVKERLA